MKAGAKSTAPSDIDQVEIRLFVDGQVIVLIPESTQHYPKKLATLVAAWDWTAEPSPTQRLRCPTTVVLRRVQRHGVADYWDLSVKRARHDSWSMTGAMFDVVGEGETERVFEILRPLARPCSWPAWIPNDEDGELSLAPELPTELDPIIWKGLRTQIIEVYGIEDDHVRFDLPLFALGDSLHAVELMLAIECHFDFEIDDEVQEELTEEGKTIEDLYKLVTQLLNAKP